MKTILDPNHNNDFYKKTLLVVLLILIIMIMFYIFNGLTFATFKISSFNIKEQPDVNANTNIPLIDTYSRRNNKGNKITNVKGIVSIRTGSVPTAWKITANINISSPDSVVVFSLYDMVKKAKFGTEVVIKVVQPFGGTALIHDYIQLPANSTFIFSLQGTANPPAFISTSDTNQLVVQQVRLDGFN